jgi:hypothetical protein
MSTTELVERYLATWNEQDPTRRRAEIDKVWAEDASYVDPLVDARGRDAIDAAIAGVQQQFPGFGFRLAGAVDAHHNLARFTWELTPDGAEAVVVGVRRRRADRGRQAALGARLPRQGAELRTTAAPATARRGRLDHRHPRRAGR